MKERLSNRINVKNIQEMIHLGRDDEGVKRELYDLIYDPDERIAYQAAWVLTHFSSQENEWLNEMQDDLIDEAVTTPHTGKRRLLLTLLNDQVFQPPLRIDFLDFCLQKMIAHEEPYGIRSLCMKISYTLCRPIPELLQEYRVTIEMMEEDLAPSLAASRRNILKTMKKRGELP